MRAKVDQTIQCKVSFTLGVFDAFLARLKRYVMRACRALPVAASSGFCYTGRGSRGPQRGNTGRRYAIIEGAAKMLPAESQQKVSGAIAAGAPGRRGCPVKSRAHNCSIQSTLCTDFSFKIRRFLPVLARVTSFLQSVAGPYREPANFQPCGASRALDAGLIARPITVGISRESVNVQLAARQLAATCSVWTACINHVLRKFSRRGGRCRALLLLRAASGLFPSSVCPAETTGRP